MSPELIAIIVMGLALSGMLIAFDIRMERRVNRMIRRIDRLEELMMQRFDRLEELMMRRFDAMEARLIGLEQGQAHLAGEMSTLREAILLRAAIQG